MSDRSRFLTRRTFLAASAAAVASPHLALAGGTALERIGGRAFGTLWLVAAPAGSGLDELRSGIERILDEVDRLMSPWRSDAEIALFNAGDAGTHRVSDDTVTVTSAALALAASSGGHFDPTVGPLVARWGFGPITGDAESGWRQIAAGAGRIEKARPGLTLDLCGIAKGFALDRIARHARDAGRDSLMLDIGGELLGVGAHPSGRPWQFAIENPLGTGAVAVLSLSDRAVATSGLRAQSYELAGRQYGHIIDPTTCDPARGALRSVSVVADDAMTADGWATALFAAGASKGAALARRHGIEAVFVSDVGGQPEIAATGGIADVLL